MSKLFTLLSGILIFQITGLAQHDKEKYVPDPDPRVHEKLEEWQDLKFGLLMHWGPYCQWGIVESWSICPEDYGWCERKKGQNPGDYYEYVKEYENLRTTFNPVDFDPSKWAEAARDAGMKYVVFTTKHHDGFCMFDSDFTDYKVTGPDCPFHAQPKANIALEIFDAFRTKGLWTGAYFSKPDWHCDHYWDPYFPPLDRNVNYDPAEYPEKWEKYVQFTHNQIMELMSDYGKIDILWLDGGWVARQEPEKIKEWYHKEAAATQSGFLKSNIVSQDIRMDELVQKAREKQPGLIVVDRAVPGKNQNYLTPENRVPEQALPYPWESCIIAGGGWSWVPEAGYMKGREAVHLLVDIVAKGGNLLLNIAPGPEGQWHPQAYELLSDIGNWMKVNGEAIYETRAIPPYREGKVCLTKKKDGSVYAIYLADENEKGLPPTVRIPSKQLTDNPSVTLVGVDALLKWKKDGDGFVVEVPEQFQIVPPCKYAWALKISQSAGND
ncbi:MAG: alpha-L-fucosidase [Bacteroidales bacterium]|nr:alpha-L-fucosidase [Bacteroidales bacterium]